MNAIDKTVSTDISLGHLLDVLAVASDAPLVFSYDSTSVRILHMHEHEHPVA